MPTMKRTRNPAAPSTSVYVTQSAFDRLLAAQREDHAELTRVGRVLEIQFQRIAQIQAGLDELRKAWRSASLPSNERLAQIQADLDEIKRAWDKVKNAS